MILQKTKAFLILIQFVITVSIVIVVMRFFNNHTWKVRKTWARLQAYLIGYKLTIKGKPDKDADILLINHQSLLDIVILEANYPKDIAWVAKKEIADMKFFGQIITLPKNIILDRENRRSLVKLFKDVKTRLEDGRVIGMFPEGTRGSGENLLEFKSGAKLISEKLNLKVQPIVIVNTRDIVDSQNFLAKSGKVSLIYLDSITPNDDKNWYDNLHKNMQEVLVKELQLLKKH
jgi:1-acyl-sn-glycerol-3-phosphate acyltransferase